MLSPDIGKLILIENGLHSREIEYRQPYMGNFPATLEVLQKVVFFTRYPTGFREAWTDISIPTDLKWVYAQFTDLMPNPDPSFRVTPLGIVMGRFSFTEKVGTNSSRNITTVEIPDRQLRAAARKSGFDGKILETASTPAQRLIQICPCPNDDIMILLAEYEERFIEGTTSFNFWVDMILRNPLGDTDIINSRVLPKMEATNPDTKNTTKSQRALFLHNPGLLKEDIRQRITQE